MRLRLAQGFIKELVPRDEVKVMAELSEVGVPHSVEHGARWTIAVQGLKCHHALLDAVSLASRIHPYTLSRGRHDHPHFTTETARLRSGNLPETTETDFFSK